MLSSLPPEILLLIANHLDNHKDILHLASCTRGFHAFLYPHAFRILVLRDTELYELTRLTHVLAQNPRCAQAVRVLRFDPRLRSRPDIQEEEKVKYDGGVILPVLERSGFGRAAVAKWKEKLTENMDTDAWTAVILTLVPNIEELAMTFSYPSFYVRKLLATSIEGGTEPIFARLRELSARWYDTENGLPSAYILPFLRLPSLRILNGVMIEDARPTDEHDLRREVPPSGNDSWDEDYEEPPDYEVDPEGYFKRYPGDENFSNTTHIKLEYSNSGKGFPDLIRACRGLVSFVYEHGNCGELDHLAPRRFYPSLCKHRESLEELTICYSRWWFMHGDPAESEFIGSFRDFAVLKRLRLRSDNIFVRGGRGEYANLALGMLPPSLEALAIEDFDWHPNPIGFVKRLKELRSAIKSQCPNIASLKVIVGGKDMPPQEDGWPLYSAPSRCVHGTRRAAELVAPVADDPPYDVWT
ncbi:hypothetical protein BDV19DRAFT_374370 [Aspergillus venezuelensis]